MILTQKKLITGILFAILLVFTGGTLEKSFADTAELFIDIPQDTPFDTENGYIINSQTVSVDTNMLQNDEIIFAVFDKTYQVTKNYVTIRDANDYAWSGSGDDVQVLFTVFDSEIRGTIITLDGKFLIKPNYSDDELVNHIITYPNLGMLAPEILPEDNNINVLSGSIPFISVPQWEQIRKYETSYNPNTDYSDKTVTIDVMIGYTSAVDDKDNRISRTLQGDIDNANHANQASGLPVKLNLIDTEEVRGYAENSLAGDRYALENDSDFNRLRANAEKQNADVLVLITHPGDGAKDIDDYGGCGAAKEVLAQSVERSIAVVAYKCLDDSTLTHEIGHLQGAAHNKDATDFGNKNKVSNPWFTTGYGYYDVNAKARTVMSYDCDSEKWKFETAIQKPTCLAYEVWSDPNTDFHGTTKPTGTDDKNNAKVIYATAPYIASLRGDVQSYDDNPPQGFFEWLFSLFTQGETMVITATFNESIDDSYSPHLTIGADNGISNTYEMTKMSDTVYSISHLLTEELGDVTLSFSNARDLFGNKVVPTPTSGGVVKVQAPDIIPPVITLNNPTEMTIDVGSTFIDPGYSAIDNVDGNVTSNVLVLGSVDTTTLGTYNKTYDVSDVANNPAKQKIRTINVVDRTSPVFSFVPSDQTFEARGDNTPLDSNDYGIAIATDNYDPSPIITNNASSTFPLGDTQIEWRAIDSSNNDATAIQTITIVVTPPVIETTVPDAPIIESVTEDNGDFTIKWKTPNDNAHIVKYQILTKEYGTSNLLRTDVSGDFTSHTFTDLPVSSYKFLMTATNEIGTSKYSNLYKIEIHLPQAPIITSITKQNGNFTVNWMLLYNEIYPIEQYQFVLKEYGTDNWIWGDKILVNDISSRYYNYTITDLTGTNYQFVMTATNEVGTSKYSNIYTTDRSQ